jgi:release factor glutamine methyltransferase
MTVLEVLNELTGVLRAHEIENPRLEAELLLAHVLGLGREGLYVRFQEQVTEEEKEHLRRFMDRRVSGEPLQYILGRQEFWSIDLRVDPRVLIPRPETEILVSESLSIVSRFPEATPKILEIGTGSGAVAVALARELRSVFLVATDISFGALQVARENAAAADVSDRIHFIRGDLFDPFHSLEGEGPFDLIVSNPPYIRSSEIESLEKGVRDYEPTSALEAGEDGLDCLREIVLQTPHYLSKGGWLLLEVGRGQGPEVSDLIKNQGRFLEPGLVKDLSGIERVAKAQRK